MTIIVSNKFLWLSVVATLLTLVSSRMSPPRPKETTNWMRCEKIHRNLEDVAAAIRWDLDTIATDRNQSSEIHRLLPTSRKLKLIREKIAKQVRRKPKDQNCNKDRNLQDDPCTAKASLATFMFNGFTLWRASFLETCAESINVDDSAMELHIQSMREIFHQYHCFYDIANDPINSNPFAYQPEFGNTIVGPGEGAVNADEGLIKIATKVTLEGADMADFWDIEEVFSRYFDGHITMPAVQDDFYHYFIIAIPDVFNGLYYSVFTLFYFDENQQIQMNLKYIDNIELGANPQVVSVETVNGQSVHDFILGLANNPALRLNAQSIGGRINLLVKNDNLFTGIQGIGRPTSILPDSFLVTFAGGGSNTFVTGCFSPTFNTFYNTNTVDGITFLKFSRTRAEELINSPGEQFVAYGRAIFDIENLALRGNRKKRSLQEHTSSWKAGLKAGSSRHKRSLQNTIWDENDGTPYSKFYGLNDDVMVLKVQAVFDTPTAFANLWKDMVKSASAIGQTKLLFDLSGNGGGSVMTAYTMLFLLFPEVDIFWFQNQWDMNFNSPMREYFEALIPVVDAVANELPLLTEQDWIDRARNITYQDIQVYQIVANALVELCNRADPTGVESLAQCQTVKDFQGNLTAFTTNPSFIGYISILRMLLYNVLEYSPWSVTMEIVESGSNENITSDLFFEGPITFLRGGVQSNRTVKFNLIDEDTLLLVKNFTDSITAEVGNPFDEYIFVSDGTSASAASIVPHVAKQLWRNRDRTVASRPVNLLAYGGMGSADDLMLSSIPANVQGVHLEDPIIGEASLFLLVEMLPRALPSYDVLVAESDDYSVSVAIPPYFADSLPRMPVVSFYEIGMEPGAAPMQFVRFYVDYYVPKFYGGVSLVDQSDLIELYTAVVPFFGGIVAPTNASTGNPKMNPTSSPATKNFDGMLIVSVLFAAVIHIMWQQLQ